MNGIRFHGNELGALTSSITLGAVVLIALAALGYALLRVTTFLSQKIDEIQPLDSPPTPPPVDHAMLDRVVDNATRIEAIEGGMRDLFQAVADGIDHVDRNEKRVRGIVTGAQRRFETSGYADPGVDAEEGTLPLLDEGRGTDERVPAVSGDVEPYPTEGIPGSVPPGFLQELTDGA